MGNLVSRLLFQPPVPTYRYEDRINFWLFTRLGEKIPAFYINQHADLTVLFSHGNAEDLNMIYPALRDLSLSLRVNVMGYDYTGYGLSSGSKPSEEACYADAEAALEYITDVLDIPHTRLVLLGRSLGSGITCHIAEMLSRAGTPPRGVVLECPLLSVYRVAFNLRFTMPGDMFVNVDKAPHIACPVCIIHGAKDEVVPFWHGQQLFLALQEQYRARPLWVEGAGHNNIELVCAAEGNRLIRHLQRFLDNDLRRPRPLGAKAIDHSAVYAHAVDMRDSPRAAAAAVAAAAAAAAASDSSAISSPVARYGEEDDGSVSSSSAQRLAAVLGIDGTDGAGERRPATSPLNTARERAVKDGQGAPVNGAEPAASPAV